MAAGFNNCQVIEAIQNLPPELREIIYKHYLAIKLKEESLSVGTWFTMSFQYNLFVLKERVFSIFWCV